MNKFTIMERLWMWWNNVCPVHLAGKIRVDSLRDYRWVCSDCWKQERQKRIREQELARQAAREKYEAKLQQLREKQ